MSTALATVDPRATALAAVKCGYYKDLRSEEQALIKIMAGAEMGISPIQSLSNVHIVEGRPTIGVHGVAAAIRRSGRYDYEVLESSAEVCRIVFVRLDRGPQPVRMGESVWTIEDARRAGLAGRGPWKSYAEDMLYARAMTRGARRYCPDVFGGGVYTAEELGAGGVASAEVSVEAAPQRAALPSAPPPPEVIEAVVEEAPAPPPARARTPAATLLATASIIATHVGAPVGAVGRAILARYDLASSTELDLADPDLVKRLLDDAAAVSQDPERARRWWARVSAPPAPAPREWHVVNGELHALIARLAEAWEGIDVDAATTEVHRITRYHAALPDTSWALLPPAALERSVTKLRELLRIDDPAELERAWSAWSDSAPVAA